MIIINLDVMMAKRKMSLNELSDKVGITLANLSILKNNHAKALRLSTLDALCRALDCQPADILEYVPDTQEETVKESERQVKPGENKTVSFEITEPMLRYWTKELKHVSEKGEFHVFIGKDSTCKPFASFNLI